VAVSTSLRTLGGPGHDYFPEAAYLNCDFSWLSTVFEGTLPSNRPRSFLFTSFAINISIDNCLVGYLMTLFEVQKVYRVE
jgi:hypothetical protein